MSKCVGIFIIFGIEFIIIDLNVYCSTMIVIKKYEDLQI
jgi:hypothetical protein